MLLTDTLNMEGGGGLSMERLKVTTIHIVRPIIIIINQ